VDHERAMFGASKRCVALCVIITQSTVDGSSVF